jgi:hypothetical protein
MRTPNLAQSLLLVAALASPTAATAQMNLSVGGGVVAATFSGDDADALGEGIGKGSRVGISAGASLAIPISNQIYIVPGGYYVQKGAEYSEGSTTVTFKADYVEIPVFMSVMLTGADSPVGFNIFAGPTFAFEAGCDIEGEDSGTTVSLSCDDLGLDERQKLDIGVAGGAGVSFPIGDRLSLMVNAGYDLGLRKLDTSSEPDDIKNSAFFGSVGVGIPVG